MIKFIYVILMNLFRAPYMIPKMRREADHPEKYSVEERYALARHVIRLMKVTGGIHTKSYGTELLPTEGGYMMYPNHQGKYDALGIIYTHREPCSLVMDKAKSNTILVREFVDLLQGNSFCLGPVTTQVHYLKPILYDEYGGLKTHEIADLVKVRIQEKLDEVLKPAEAPVG